MRRTTWKLVLAAGLALSGSGCAGLLPNFNFAIPADVFVASPTSDVEVLAALPGIRKATFPALTAAGP